MRIAHGIVVVAGLNLLLVSYSLGQGSLTPPGPPSPTMKTLDQVEPRIPIDATHTPSADKNNTFVISNPGSYYLTGNIRITTALNGISVQASDVTIDLNGYTLSGPGKNASGGSAIVAASGNDVRVRNGFVDGWPGDGISLGAVAVVENLDVQNCGGYGVHAGEQAQVRHCRVGAVHLGISVGDSSMVDSCLVIASATTNIATGAHSLITHNVSTYSVQSPPGYGIYPASGSIVRDNVCNKNKKGIFTDFTGVLIEGNVAEQNTVYGIEVADDSNVVIRNVAGFNGLADYVKPASAPNFGTIQSPSSMTNPAANIQF